MTSPTVAAVVNALPLHLAVLDSQGVIVQLNEAWRNFGRQQGLGWSHGDLGTNYLDACKTAASRGDAYADQALAGLLGLLAGTRSSLAIEYPCDAPGLTRWFLLQASPCRVCDQRGAVVVHLDVSARRRVELALEHRQAQSQREAARFGFILDLSVDAICCLDDKGYVISASASAERLWGRPVSELVGRPWGDLIEGPDRGAAGEALVELQRTSRPLTLKSRGAHRDRRPLLVEWTAQWSAAQQITVVVARDVTQVHVSSAEHRQAIEALRESEERFRLIARATSDAVWEWDAATGNVWWSQGLGGVFGDVAGNWQDGMAAWERRVHPEDLPNVKERFQGVVAGLDAEFSMEYRFRRLDGEWASVLARGFVVRDAGGRAVRALGGLTDLSELRRAEADARRAAHVQGFIVQAQQELARPGLTFDDLLQLTCERARELMEAAGAVIELREGESSVMTRFATSGHRGMIGQAVPLANSFSGEVLLAGRPLWCEDCSQDPRVDPVLARRAGAVAMIAAPLRRGEEVIGVIKVLSERRRFFTPANVDHLQSLAESLRIILHRLHSEGELARIHRTQRLASLVSVAQARIDDETAFAREVSRLAVDEGGYHAAVIAYRNEGERARLRKVGQAGAQSQQAFDWLCSEDDVAAALIAEAIRTNQPQAVTFVESADAASAPSMITHGFRSATILPLQWTSENVLGVLGLFCMEAASESRDERAMLRDLSNSLAFGIRHIRAQRDKRHLEAAVLQVATSVSAGAPNEYFEQLCRSLAEALDAPAAFVARIVRHSGVARARTLAGIVDGQLTEPFEYDCAGTPCEQLLVAEESIIPRDLQQRYDMRNMRFANAQAYAGRSLRDSTGLVVGLLIVMWRVPMPSQEFSRSVLGIFATRAAFELERRQTEIKLREQASLLDQAKDAIVVRDLDGRIRFWNKGAERLYGWSSSEAMGQNMALLLGEDAQTAQSALEQVKNEGQWSGLLHYQHRAGHAVPCDAHWTLVLNAEGRAQSILTINTDVTQRLRVEEQLRQSHRLESVGQLTGGVAHDFNNLLTVILGNAELLTEMLGHMPDARELAEMVRDAAQRGADLTHQLLAFSRRQTLHPQPVDVDRLIRGLMGLLRRTLPESITVEHQAHSTWLCLVDPGQLESAVLNLCLNARDAMPRGGRIRIESENWNVEAAAAGDAAEVRPGPYVRLRVVDRGSGISPSDLPRVIEPFFTTKPVGKGTGLGLSMVYGFAKQSQGHLGIESQLGQGTTISLYLPRAQAVEVRDAGSAQRAPQAGGTESILLVEDDPMVRRFAEGLLTGLGYRVTAVADGNAALAVLESEAPVDLLFTDVVMPGGVTGPELVEAGRLSRPGLRALYASGYTENALEDVSPARAAGLLQKPYRRADLAAAVRAALMERVDA